MIKSMTGYGKAHFETENKDFNIAIKSLNSKQLDFYFKAPAMYRDKELEIRTMVSASAMRGKIEVMLQVTSKQLGSETSIDYAVFKHHYDDLKKLADELNDNSDILSIVSRFPDVFKTAQENMSEEEWSALQSGVKEALSDLNTYRENEGKALAEDIRLRINNISSGLQHIVKLAPERMETVKARISKHLEEHLSAEKINEDRFEQEMIYYLEKLDITEEKIRLQTHCDYFLEIMNGGESSGKKLGFVAQEIGREINTIGSKANHAEIQKLVVQMKDELEKIKEQLLNVL